MQMFTRQLKMCWLRISIGNYEINKGNEECRPGNIEITIMAGVILGYFKMLHPFLVALNSICHRHKDAKNYSEYDLDPDPLP
jgi:hypothetical protein